MSKRKHRWSREFKEAAVARMESAETVCGLALELGVCRELLFKWRRNLEVGGAATLRGTGRPPKARAELSDAAPPASVPADLAAARQRIEELERKIGQQQLELDFFRTAPRLRRGKLCGMSGRHVRSRMLLARERLRGDPRGDGAARRSIGDRTDVRAGRCEPRQLLPSLARIETAPGRDGVARCDSALVVGAT